MPFFERLELLQRKRVDRAHQPKLALELAHPRVGGDTLRQRRAFRGHRRFRLAVEVVPDGLDRRLESQRDLGLVELRTTRALAHLFELPLGRGATLALAVERLRDLPRLLGLATPLLVQRSELLVDLRRRPAHDSGEAVESWSSPARARSAGRPARSRSATSACRRSLDLVATPHQHLPALVETRGLNFEMGAQRGDRPGPLVESRRCRRARTEPCSRRLPRRPREPAGPARAR